MNGDTGEKRKAEEMEATSVEVPLNDLREVAEKAGEKQDKKKNGTIDRYCTQLRYPGDRT